MLLPAAKASTATVTLRSTTVVNANSTVFSCRAGKTTYIAQLLLVTVSPIQLHLVLQLELTDLISCQHQPLPCLSYCSMSPGPCGFFATQPVLSVAGQQSAGAAFGLRIQEWMVRENEETGGSRSMWPVFINPRSRLPSLPNHNPAILGRQEVIYQLSWLSQHHRPTV